MRVRHDVRGIEHLFVPKSTERALPPIRFQHPFPEGSLVEPYTDDRSNVTAARIIEFLVQN